MKKLSVIMAVLFVLTSMFATMPISAEEQSVGPWVADFSQIQNTFGANNCSIDWLGDAGWTYDESGDYALTNGKEAHLIVGNGYAQDYTIGFKINIPDVDGYSTFKMKLKVLRDLASKSASNVNAESAEPNYEENATDAWLALSNFGSAIVFHKNDLVFGNLIGADYTKITKNITVGSWSDVKMVVDYSDDENSSVLFTLKGYLNGELISNVEIPKQCAVSVGSDYYWSKVISPANFQFGTKDGTKIKDLYMYNGTDDKSIVPVTTAKTFDIDGQALANLNFDSTNVSAATTDWSDGKGFNLLTKGTTREISNGYATMSFTQGTNTASDHPLIYFGPQKNTNGKFVWRGKFKPQNFLVDTIVIQFGYSADYYAAVLTANKAVDENGQSLDRSTLTLYGDTTCEIENNKWYSAEIVGTRKSNLWTYDVLVKDCETDSVLIKKSVTDYTKQAPDNNIRWRSRFGTKSTLNALPAGATTSFSVDDIYFAPATSFAEYNVHDVKITQGNSLLSDKYSVDSEITMSAIISNYKPSEKDVSFIVAEYDSENTLLNVKTMTKTIGAGIVTDYQPAPNTDVFSTKITPATNSSKIKCFVWEGENKIEPLTTYIELTKNN